MACLLHFARLKNEPSISGDEMRTFLLTYSLIFGLWIQPSRAENNNIPIINEQFNLKETLSFADILEPGGPTANLLEYSQSECRENQVYSITFCTFYNSVTELRSAEKELLESPNSAYLIKETPDLFLNLATGDYRVRHFRDTSVDTLKVLMVRIFLSREAIKKSITEMSQIFAKQGLQRTSIPRTIVLPKIQAGLSHFSQTAALITFAQSIQCQVDNDRLCNLIKLAVTDITYKIIQKVEPGWSQMNSLINYLDQPSVASSVDLLARSRHMMTLLKTIENSNLTSPQILNAAQTVKSDQVQLQSLINEVLDQTLLFNKSDKEKIKALRGIIVLSEIIDMQFKLKSPTSTEMAKLDPHLISLSEVIDTKVYTKELQLLQSSIIQYVKVTE